MTLDRFHPFLNAPDFFLAFLLTCFRALDNFRLAVVEPLLTLAFTFVSTLSTGLEYATVSAISGLTPPAIKRPRIMAQVGQAIRITTVIMQGPLLPFQSMFQIGTPRR